jgi:hypothetical protein
MGRRRIYPPGQAPSDLKDYSKYVPRQSLAGQRIDSALGELCDLQIGEPLTQAQIADFCDCSQMMIYKIEKKARRKLRTRLEALGIVPLPGGRGLDVRAALRGL